MIVPYQTFDTRRRRPLCLAPGNDRLWARCAAGARPSRTGRPIRASPGARRGSRNKAELLPMIAAAMRGQHRAPTGSPALEKAGVPCSPVNDIGELAATRAVRRGRTWCSSPCGRRERRAQVVGLPITFDRERPRSPRSAPKLGEHTDGSAGQALGLHMNLPSEAGEVAASYAVGGVMGRTNAVASDPSVADRALSHEVQKRRRATSQLAAEAASRLTFGAGRGGGTFPPSSAARA